MAEVQREHGPDCDCARCRGFELGNDAAVTHGADSPRRMKPRADRYLELVRGEHTSLTGDPGSVGVALERLARQLARADLIEEWADENGWVRDDGSLQPAVVQLATIDNSIRKMLDALGLTELSRASLRESLLRGDLIDAAVAQAGFRATMGTAVDVVRELAEARLPADVRASFLREFWARYLPAAEAAVGRVGLQRELPAGEFVSETDEPATEGSNT